MPQTVNVEGGVPCRHHGPYSDAIYAELGGSPPHVEASALSGEATLIPLSTKNG